MINLFLPLNFFSEPELSITFTVVIVEAESFEFPTKCMLLETTETAAIDGSLDSKAIPPLV